MVRQVHIDTKPSHEPWREKFENVPKATKSLDFSAGVRGRVGQSSANPDVMAFFESIQGKAPEPEALPLTEPGARAQRLKLAPPIRPETYYPGTFQGPEVLSYAQGLIEQTRKPGAMVGLPVEREAYRQIPKQRMSLVVRPGFRERGQAAMASAEEEEQVYEKAMNEARHARMENTRRRLREVAGQNRATPVTQPVLQRAAHKHAVAEYMHQLEAEREWTLQGVADVERLPSPPATPGPRAPLPTAPPAIRQPLRQSLQQPSLTDGGVTKAITRRASKRVGVGGIRRPLPELLPTVLPAVLPAVLPSDTGHGKAAVAAAAAAADGTGALEHLPKVERERLPVIEMEFESNVQRVSPVTVTISLGKDRKVKPPPQPPQQLRSRPSM